MNTVITSLLILSIMPLLCAWIAAYFKQKQLGRVDNKDPRGQSAQLTGAGARAVAAQANTWEALGVYVAALLATVIAGIPMEQLSTLALVFTALRIAYIPAYLANQDAIRSLIYIGGFGICMYMFYLSLSA